MQTLPLFTDGYLFAHFEDEYQAYAQSRDDAVRQLLKEWNDRDKGLTETQLNGQFVQRIFQQLWGYWGTGTVGSLPGYTLLPECPVESAGQSGGTGKADLALAHFAHPQFSDLPQVLCEFKDIKSGLDAPQNRKGNNRSPVQQCLDYLKHSFDKAPVNAPVVPTWGLVTDMDEFRLYYRKLGNAQCQKFTISSVDGGPSLIDATPEAARQRFLFCKLFSYDALIARSGTSALERLLQRQWTYSRALEKSFYKEYQEYRQHVYEAIIETNPAFGGTRGDIVRMTQRFLDRCIFLLFCEDMGRALTFPVDLLRDILIQESLSPSYSPYFDNVWSLVKQLFHTMRDGGPFPPDHQIHRFNGGLFEDLQDLERLRIPNRIFCAKGQGESPDKLVAHKNTLLYLSATYNFGTTSGSRERTITLYTLGRIFEQSITDLEYMHADAEGVPTIANVSKRRRDGVYYTPEWVTSYIVQQVLGPRLAEERERIGLQLGADISQEDLLKYRRAKAKPKTNSATIHLARLDAYESFVNRMTILDPACGSGAFLIQSLQFLQNHRRALAIERERVTGHPSLFDQDATIRSILSRNLFGVDINPESVEITQLALWLHTAAPGKPLSTLSDNIRCGNSLVDGDFAQFYREKHETLFAAADRSEQEKVNAFDWAKNFPSILGPDVPPEDRGFDCVIGNPPYVKLQHFRKVVPDVAEYLVRARAHSTTPGTGQSSSKPCYESTQKGNFDLYLPFIERGVSLLHSQGHMGFIAPSVWLLNEYGQGLKEWLIRTRHLERWVDFKDFPVFDEAMTYTALQFYSARAASAIAFASVADGELASVEDEGSIRYESLDPDEPWVFLPDREQGVINKLRLACTALGDLPYVEAIFVGVQTSADYIFHLDRI
ncbi:MAG: Eco57I restriction-modification methylase domain-containing protein, partial [Isosphaeraceae bacterium]